jgi:hypothetical protein
MWLAVLLMTLVASPADAKRRKPTATNQVPTDPSAAAAPAPPPPPKGRMDLEGAELISGPLTGVDGVVRGQKGTMETCYQREFAKDSRLQGVFVFDLTIARSGRVKDIEPTKDSVKSEALAGCILGAMRRVRFAKANGESIARVRIVFVPAPPPPAPPAAPLQAKTSNGAISRPVPPTSGPGLRR